jgi:anthranilate phosphoribosyltransferase
VAELRDGEVRSFTVTPEELGIKTGKLSDISVKNAAESLSMVESVLDGQAGPARDVVSLNAGAAIYAAGLAASLAAGVKRASEVIESGAARDKFYALVGLSKKLAGHA